MDRPAHECLLKEIERGIVKCARCGRTGETTLPVEAIHWGCPQSSVVKEHREKRRAWPGAQLQAIIRRRLGQQAVAGCGCGGVIQQMNEWGVAGCREHVEEITDRLVNVATEKQWLLGDEPGVAPADVGKPVPQTRRTRFLRLLARTLATTSTGAAMVRDRCRAMVVLAIRRAERATQR